MIGPGGERVGAVRKLDNKGFQRFVRIIMIILTRTRRWNVDFIYEFYA